MSVPPGPARCRGTDARPALACVVLVALLVAWVGWRDVTTRPSMAPIVTPSAPPAEPWPPEAIAMAAAVATALVPTPTPTPPRPVTRPPQTPATVLPVCGTGVPDGAVCAWPPPTSTLPPTTPPCETYVPDGKCRWEGGQS